MVIKPPYYHPFLDVAVGLILWSISLLLGYGCTTGQDHSNSSTTHGSSNSNNATSSLGTKESTSSKAAPEISPTSDSDRIMGSSNAFFFPKILPKIHYDIQVELGLTKETVIKGSQKIHLKNISKQTIHQLIFEWEPKQGSQLVLFQKGEDATNLSEGTPTDASLQAFLLSQPILPGESADLVVHFETQLDTSILPNTSWAEIHRWHPKLWWGKPYLATYSVRVKTAPNVQILASGKWLDSVKQYQAPEASDFAIILYPTMEQSRLTLEEINIEGVFHKAKDPSVELLMASIKSGLEYLRYLYGAYPNHYISLIQDTLPNMPFSLKATASNIIKVSGLEQIHQLEPTILKQHIMDSLVSMILGYTVFMEPPSLWLIEALKHHLVQRWMDDKNMSASIHQNYLTRYTAMVQQKNDIVLEQSDPGYGGLFSSFRYAHLTKQPGEDDKGYAFIQALKAFFGTTTFYSILDVLINDFKGQDLSTKDFQVYCEEKTHQNLEWLFDPWLYSTSSLSYQLESATSTLDKKANIYQTAVVIHRIGSLSAALPIKAIFSDQTQQTQTCLAVATLTTITFISNAPIQSVQIDAENRHPLLTRTNTTILK